MSLLWCGYYSGLMMVGVVDVEVDLWLIGVKIFTDNPDDHMCFGMKLHVRTYLGESVVPRIFHSA